MNKAEIFYKDIGDYLSREEKLRIVKEDRSIRNHDLKMTRIKPNKHGDWINKRNSIFSDLIPLESEKKFDTQAHSFFVCLSGSIVSSRDAWCYNFSKSKLQKNIKKTIQYYNEQRKLIIAGKVVEPSRDSTKGSWSRDWLNYIKKNVVIKEDENEYRISQYRPFVKCNFYFADELNQERYQMSKFFPKNNSQNLTICVSCAGTKKGLSVFICDNVSDYHFIGDTQCFPLYWYQKKEKIQNNLFENSGDDYIRHDAISDFILDQTKTRYGGRVTKEDIFYYVYGILHSPDYRITFANDLKKMLPRLSLVEKPADFWAFSEAGRKLADLHLNYEEQKNQEDVTVSGMEKGNFTVEKMRFTTKKWGEGKWSEGKWGELKKDAIVYNSYITISNIPLKAYEYIVNGKSAIEWVMERYAVTTHKESGIKNDPNDWAVEHENPQYILDLLLSVITVSMKTVDIIAGLPKVEWE